MSRKKSKYRPRPIIQDTMTYVRVGVSPVTDTGPAATRLLLTNREALESLLKGEGTQWHVDILIEVFNLAEAMAMMRMGHDWMSEIHECQDAMYSMAVRGLKTGRYVFTGPEMEIVKTIMALHEEQLKTCTVNQLDEALKLIQECKRLKKPREIKAEEDAPYVY
jgi:hypothetical protein